MPKAPASPRILQIVPALDLGGVERGTVDLARYLVGQGWQAEVASSGGRYVNELKRLGVTHTELPLSSKNPFTIRRNRTALLQLIRKNKIDLVHVRSRAPAWSAWHAAKAAKVPFVTTFHAAYHGHERWLKNRYNSIMTRGDKVIAVSSFIADHIKKHYKIKPKKISTILRGVDCRHFNPEGVSGARIAAVSDKWHIEPGQKVIILPGRISRIKGHLFTVKACKLLKRDDYVVVFVGDVDHGSRYVMEVEKAINKAGLSERIRFGGQCDDMVAAYSLADLVIVPSQGEESFGRISTEAQAMGKPVIVSDIGGLPETLQPDETGWLVPHNDAKAFARAMDHALSLTPEVKGWLATNARHFVEQKLSNDQMCAQTLNVYEELLKIPPRSRRG